MASRQIEERAFYDHDPEYEDLSREPANLKFPKRQVRADGRQGSPRAAAIHKTMGMSNPMYNGERMQLERQRKQFLNEQLDQNVINEHIQADKLEKQKRRENRLYLKGLEKDDSEEEDDNEQSGSSDSESSDDESDDSDGESSGSDKNSGRNKAQTRFPQDEDELDSAQR